MTVAMWAIDHLTPRLLVAIAREADQRIDGLEPTLASSMLWSLARLGFLPDARLVHKLCQVLAGNAEELAAPELANVWWALGKLMLRPSDAQLARLLARTRAEASSLSPTHVVDLAWGLARMPSGAVPAYRGGRGQRAGEEAGGAGVEEKALLDCVLARGSECERAGLLSEEQVRMLRVSRRALRAQGRVPWTPG